MQVKNVICFKKELIVLNVSYFITFRTVITVKIKYH